MALKEDLVHLYQLQRTDSHLDRLAEELSTLDDGARAVRRAQEAAAAAQAAATSLKEAEGQLKDHELSLESAEAERQQKWQRAYGGTVSDAKELSALERKIEELDRRKGKLEEEILALYESVESLRTQAREAEQRAAETALRAKRVRAHFVRRTKEIGEEQAALRAQREAQLQELPEALYRQYEQRRATQEGVAVAAVVGGNCEFCHTRTPAECVAELRRGLRIIHCESCGRILALDE